MITAAIMSTRLLRFMGTIMIGITLVSIRVRISVKVNNVSTAI
jgi:hypothetical protein